MQLDRGDVKRTKYDANIIKIYPKHNCAVIYIFDINGVRVGKSFISLCDLERVKKHKWCIGSRGHVVSSINNKIIRLHRFILNVTESNVIVKHYNKNAKDNRRKNLYVIRKTVSETT